MYHNPKSSFGLLILAALLLALSSKTLAHAKKSKPSKNEEKHQATIETTSPTSDLDLSESTTSRPVALDDQRSIVIHQVDNSGTTGSRGSGKPDDGDLEVAASNAVQDSVAAEETNSHKIIAAGWPSTSPMWPSIETAEQQAQEANWPEMIEPFIFADKPRAIDYSLLLTINKNITDALKDHQKSIAVVLSFEYYFNYDAKITTAPPGIKIEIDRKQFKYLEPNVNNIAPRMWIKFNEQILVSDPQQFENHDWLKFSLVNRQSPSLVAIRKLKVQFTPSDSDGGQPPPPMAQSPAIPLQQPNQPQVQQNEIQNGQQPPLPQSDQPLQSGGTLANQPTVYDQQQPQLPPQVQQPPQQEVPLRQPAPVEPNQGIQDQQAAGSSMRSKKIKSPKQPVGEDEDQMTAASDALVSTIKPVKPKTTGSWLPSMPTFGVVNPFGKRKRRKRQVAAPSGGDITSQQQQQPVPDAAPPPMPASIIFTCFHRNSCEWRSDRSEEIQWSSARMPASTSEVSKGYYYASSLSGMNSNPTRAQETSSNDDQPQVASMQVNNLLRLSLNQTEAARIKDQNSDQCIELAIYITERARLKLYRLSKGASATGGPSGNIDWIKGNEILTWAPTMTMEVRKNENGSNTTVSVVRSSLPKSRLPAMENGKNGWTYETLCYGDFFTNVKECGLGNCAFGFEMELDETLQSQLLAARGGQQVATDAATATASSSIASNDPLINLIPEQVVGISIRNEFSVKPKPMRQQQGRLKWLKTWNRPEVSPEENWKFYPKLDVVITSDTVNLLNTYDESHYHLHSDWLSVNEHLEFTGSLTVEFNQTSPINGTSPTPAPPVIDLPNGGDNQQYLTVNGEPKVFALKLVTKLVDDKFNIIHTGNSTIEWSMRDNTSLAVFSIDMPITDYIKSARHGQLKDPSSHSANGIESNPIGDEESSLFKIIIELIYDVKLTGASLPIDQYLSATNSEFKFNFVNVSLSDRCYPSPCQTGSCHQNGTGLEDWECKCDDGRHRGRRCEFGRWCEIPHVTPWVAPAVAAGGGLTSGSGGSPGKDQQVSSQQQQHTASQQLGPKSSIGVRRINVLTPPKSRNVVDSTVVSGGSSGANNNNSNNSRQPKLSDSISRISGSDYCQRKLGSGSKCTEIDVPLNDNLYTEDEKTFSCSCQDDYYLSDDSKCKQAHPCNSIVCPSIGMICDEFKPFNRTQPCVCNEKQDWHLDLTSKGQNGVDKCIRRQCQDISRACGFEAHICLPTLPGEKPICKCGPNFALKTNETSGAKYCQSTACILPTLNECQQICVPNNENLLRPYKCDCYPGYVIDPEDPKQSKCVPMKPEPHCRPACNPETQNCTDFGCRCKQGYIGEGEVVVKHANKHPRGQTQNSTTIDYVQSVRCLNVCSLTYAENKREFEMIESVCPLGLCDPSTFQCKCYDSSSSALVNTKYEPIYAKIPIATNGALEESTGGASGSNVTTTAHSDDSTALVPRQRISPLCHLRRVCESDSISYRICRSQGAICVPDYTKAAMFDCICPPSTEKRFYGRGSSSEFTCEPRCSSVKYECLRRQAQCRLVDKDSVRCDCLPGHMFDEHDHKCYLAKYSYSFNLILVNRYYEPESKFHRLEQVKFGDNSTIGPDVTQQTGSRLYESINGNANQVNNNNNNNNNLNRPDLSEVVPQFHQANANNLNTMSNSKTKSKFIVDYNQCNITQVIPKQIIEDPYEHDIESYLSYIDQCNEKIHQNMRTYHLNSKLAEDLRQSLRQHLRGFTVTTSNNTCLETDSTGMYLNCTVYLQSQESISAETVDFVLNNCDKNGQDNRFCWIKPRLLLKKDQQIIFSNNQQVAVNKNNNGDKKHQQKINFKQVIPCEIDNFCGPDAYSVRLDDRSSLCSCKCPPDIEVVDVKDLERKLRQPLDLSTIGGDGGSEHLVAGKLNPITSIDYQTVAVKEICAPRNHCGANSTFCLGKTGSVCHYDIRLGSKCQCVYPSYENDEGKCVEVTFSKLDDTLIILIIMLGTGLVVSIAINLFALAKSQKLFRQSKQYPLNEFPTTNSSTIHQQRSERGINRSTGVPNLGFDDD